MTKSPMDYVNIFDSFTNNEINKPQRVLKRTGKVAAFVAVIVFLIFQVTGSVQTVSVWVNIGSVLFAVSTAVAIFSFVSMVVYWYGKQHDQPTFLNALKLVIKKVVLYIFIPAVILTVILWFVFLILLR